MKTWIVVTVTFVLVGWGAGSLLKTYGRGHDPQKNVQVEQTPVPSGPAMVALVRGAWYAANPMPPLIAEPAAEMPAPPDPPSCSTNARLDRILGKLERIEKRLDAVEKNTSKVSSEGRPFGSLLRRFFSGVQTANQQQRLSTLINDSENPRIIQEEWSRFYFTDHPSHLTPNRVDGGMQ